MIDFTADFIQNWLEDNIKPELYDDMDKTVSELYTENNFVDKVDELFSWYLESREQSFTEQLNKLKN
jgi:hypothetical protein